MAGQAPPPGHAAPPPLLDIRGLTFGYGATPVLAGVKLRVEPGEIVAITGPSGSGKSTLLALAGLLRSPPERAVYHWGRDMGRASRQSLAERRRKLRFIFQRPYLLRSLTVIENVMTGALRAAETDAELKRRTSHLLGLLGLDGLGSRWPEQISGGQQQRAALARALIGRPELLLADEPTASLDFASAKAVVDQIRMLARTQGCGVLMTTHDMRIIDSADRRVDLAMIPPAP